MEGGREGERNQKEKMIEYQGFGAWRKDEEVESDPHDLVNKPLGARLLHESKGVACGSTDEVGQIQMMGETIVRMTSLFTLEEWK